MDKTRLSESGGSSGSATNQDTTQVLLHEEMFFTAILLRSAPHTLLPTAKHVLAG